MIDSALEFDFFKMLVLSIILGQPKFFINQLMKKDPREMYYRAKAFKKDGHAAEKNPNVVSLEFYQFYEFISNDIAKTLYHTENDFIELENYMLNM